MQLFLPIAFYFTLYCNLVTCSLNSTKLEDTILLHGCFYNINVSFRVISCRDRFIEGIRFPENTTDINFTNVPVDVLNETSIPPYLVHLQNLYWTRSQINTIRIISIPSMVELDLSYNNIQKIHANSTTELINLKIFNISNNQIASIPDSIFQSMHHLQHVDLSNNLLSHLPANLFHHSTQLLNLNLSYNKISVLPSSLLQSTTSLQQLNLRNNDLFILDAEIFIHLHALVELNLATNAFWSLPASLLPKNNSLVELTISHTRLSSVPSTIFKNLATLRRLHLSNNRQLRALHEDTFANLSNLKTIRLENNNLSQLPHSIVESSPDEVYISGNPWPCDCTVQWIPLWVHQASGRQNSLHLKGFCNGTTHPLLDTLLEMRCKPTTLRVSSFKYQDLKANASLMCRAYANPNTSISWATPTGYVTVSEDQNSKYQHWPKANNRNFRLRENGDLEIKSIGRDDAGEYICIATNKMGESLARVKLHIDPSIMQRIKYASLLCGILWVDTFLIFSVIFLLIKRCCKRAKESRILGNIDVYRSEQMTILQERCKCQLDYLKDHCSTRVGWIKENFKQTITNSQNDLQQYHEQMTEIHEYYNTEIQKVLEHYSLEQDLLHQVLPDRVDNEALEFSVDVNLVKMENGTKPSRVVSPKAEELFEHSILVKNQIRAMTSADFHYLKGSIQPSTDEDEPSTSFHSSVTTTKLRTSDVEENEKTSMLTNT